MTEFVHLHNHSDYSLLDGASSIKGLVTRAKEMGSPALGLTDHGNMFGALRFYQECRAAQLNPLVGCEFYLADGPRSLKQGTESGNKYYHLILLAQNEGGYRNLLKLTSRGYTEGFYYKPRIDFELLQGHNEGLICSTACLGGEIPQLILIGKEDKAEAVARQYRELFGPERFYLELQDHGIPEQTKVNKTLVELSKRTGIPLVATNDSHYLSRGDANAQDILICVGTGRKKNEPKRMKFYNNEFYLKTPAEMTRLFGEIPESLSNTLKIAEMCNLNISLPGPLLPEFELPQGFHSPEDYMRHLTYEGLKERYGTVGDEIQKRGDYELEIIFRMGYSGYFLIVWDYIRWARQHRIPVGPGRGSGAGSIVAYALAITDIDPLKYNLLFERFLNPERISMPDFDIDFCFEGRQEVIDYVTQKYGKDKVGQIITFGTLKPKAVIRDVARVLDIPYAEADAISKMIPEDLKMTLDKALTMEPKLKKMAEEEGVKGELIDVARRLEGLSRHASTHAAGLVIGQEKLSNYVPLYWDSKTEGITTQYTMDFLEDCGLVKMDILGLKTLTLIKNTEKLIRKREPEFSEQNIPEEDGATFRLLCEGKSACIFQFESSGMQGILKQAKPSNIEDLIALNALYRPGPMQFIPQFINSKNGKRRIEYPDPTLEEVLKPTYGVIVYQEQVMQVAQIIGGFSLAKADILRRAMGKKKKKDMEKMKIEFIAGAAEKGHSKKHAVEIFEMLEPFAGYGFNKSHAAAYSILAYKTAYLKANYPAEFMAANLTNEINNTDKLTEYIAEAKEMGLELIPPDINLSEKKFSVSEGRIVYGLMGVKNVGSAAVDAILKAREKEGKFTSLTNLMELVDLKTVNRKVLETLIQSGLFDSTEYNRATLFHNLETLLEFVGKKKEEEAFGQASLFDAPEHREFHEITLKEIPEWGKMDILSYEKANLGFYFSGHPMDKYRKTWERRVNLDLSQPEQAIPNRSYTLLGMVKALREIHTKKGTPMAFVQLEDFKGTIELIFFTRLWEEVRETLVEDQVIAAEGRIDVARGEPKFLVDKIMNPDEIRKTGSKELHIRIGEDLCREEELFGFRDFLINHTGDFSVYLHILPRDENRPETIVRASSQIGCSGEKETLEAIRSYPHIGEVWKE